MNEIIEILEEKVRYYHEEIYKLDDLVEYFPDFLVEATIKKDQLEEIIEDLEEIIEDFS